MTTLTEGFHAAEYLISEAAGTRSREQITVASGADLVAGTVLGKTETSTATVAAAAAVSGSGGTVGNGAIGTVTADAGAKAGVWKLLITNAATNAGNFVLYDPDGIQDGVGTVAVAYNGKLNFTLADGANDFVEDDYINITVSYPTPAPKYGALDPAATNGLQDACAILFDAAAAASADVRAVAHVRDCEVNTDNLTWPAGISAANKQIAINKLTALGIVLR